MDNNLHIPIIIGTARLRRESIKVANFIFEVSKEINGITTELVDPQNFNFSPDGSDEIDRDPKYSNITKRADGFLIVVPEYNHSFPGSLKRMLDSEYDNYSHKAVAFAGVSSGNWGGVRAIESLVNPIRELALVATRVDVYFPHVESVFDENGKLIDDNYIASVKRTFEELIWMTRALKNAKK